MNSAGQPAVAVDLDAPPRMIRCLALAAFFLAAPVSAQETAEDPNIGEQGPTVTFGGLVQTQFNTSDQRGARATSLSLRRVRLAANARLTDFVSGRLQAELAGAAVGGSAELNEAYALFQFAPAVGVLVGKGGRPFGIIDATTAARLVPIERGARFRGAEAVELYRTLEALAYAGRSVGVQVLGETSGPLGLAYAAGYFTGSTGEEGTDADIRQVAARVQASPVRGLKVAVAVTNRAFARADPPGLNPNDGARGAFPSGDTRRGSGVAVDFEVGEYGRPGLQVLGEVVVGTLDPFRGYSFRAVQGWLAYRVEGLEGATNGRVVAVEPLFRASVSNADGPVGQNDGVLLTPGVNVYAARNTRLALNLDVFLRGEADPALSQATPGDDTLIAFRGQVQIAF